MLPRSRARVLRALRKVDRFLTEERWGQRAPGLDAAGREVDPLAANAERFCLQGSLILQAPGLEGPAFRLVMRYLHQSAREVSQGRFHDVFEMNDSVETEFSDVKQVLAHTIEAIEAESTALAAFEQSEVVTRERQLREPHEAWVLARTYGERHELSIRTLALALCHAGLSGYAKISRDCGEARDTNVLLASRLFVRLTLQHKSGDRVDELAPYIERLKSMLPRNWFERLSQLSPLEPCMPSAAGVSPLMPPVKLQATIQ